MAERKVGVRLEAEAAEEFTRALQEATAVLREFISVTREIASAAREGKVATEGLSQAAQQLEQDSRKLAQTEQASSQIVSTVAEERKSLAEQLLAQGLTARETIETMVNLGISEQQAAQAVQALTGYTLQETEATTASTNATKEKVAAFTSYESVLKAVMATGVGTAEAVQRIAAAEEEGVSLSKQLSEAHKERDTILRSLVEGELTLAEAQQKLSAAAKAEQDALRQSNQLLKERATLVSNAQETSENQSAFITRLRALVEVGQQAGATTKQIADSMRAMGASTETVDAILEQHGLISSKAADAQARLAAQSKETTEQQSAFITRLRALIEIGQQAGATPKEIADAARAMGGNLEATNVILKQHGIEIDETTKKYERTRDMAGDLGKAFFGLTLLSFGLLSIQKQLRESGEDNLFGISTQNIDKITGFVQTVASFGAAGAFSGAGVPGIIAGATIGAAISLPALLDQTSESTKQLIQEFDTLANKTDAVQTLKEIGDMSARDAEEFVKLTRSSSEWSARFAGDLKEVAKAQKDLENAQIHPLVAQIGLATGQGIGQTLGGPVGAAFANKVVSDQIEYDNALLKENAQAHVDAAAAALKHDQELLPLVVAYENLNQEVEGWTKTSSNVTNLLKEQVGVTSDDIDMVQLAIKTHGEWGESLGENIKNIGLLNIGLKDAPQYADDYTKSLQEQTEAARENAAALAAAGEVIKEHESLLSKLSSLGQQTPEGDLMATAGVSEDAAERFLKFAETDRELAATTETLVTQIRDNQAELAMLESRGEGASAAALHLRDSIKAEEAALRESVLTHQDYSDLLKQLSTEQEKFAKALSESAFRQSQLEQRTQNQRDAAQQQFDNTVADAARTRSNAIFNAEQTLTNRMSDLWVDYRDRVADINTQLGDKIEDANTQLANRLEDIQAQLQERIFQIQQGLSNKIADLAYKHQQDINKANDDAQKAAEDLARKLYEIERQRIEDTERLAFSTGEQLRQARTEHERNDILRRFRFEQAQIDQKANDARNDAQYDFAQKVAQAAKERQLANQNYAHEVELAKRLAQQQIAEAQRAAAVQERQARRTAAQQIAIAEREAQQARALAERKYAEETALAQRTYEQAVQAARRAEAQKVADAERALAQKNKAIEQSFELEMQQLQRTIQAYIEGYMKVIQVIGGMNQAIQIFLQSQIQALGFTQAISAGLANMTQNITNGLTGGLWNNLLNLVPQGASGLDMVVPNEARFANDNFLVRASAGERVTISPPNTSYNTRSSNISIVINDATDPMRVGHIVRGVLVDMTSGAG